MKLAQPHVPVVRRMCLSGIGVVFLPLCLIVVVPDSVAQVWNGSMRVDYQSTAGAGRSSLSQQYYLRVSDRLLYKNQITFIGNFEHQARQGSQPAEFRPRYQWLLDSYGYGLRVSY